MGLTIVAGLANAGKTGELMRRLYAALDEGRAPVLLLPSAPDVSRARAEIARREPLGATVVQFNGFLDDLWALHGDGRRIVSRSQRVVLIRTALAATRLTHITGAAARRGLVRSLEDLAVRAGETGALDGARARLAPAHSVAADLCAALDTYSELLRERDLVERSDAHALLPAVLPARSVPGPLLVNRFASFTPPQEAFLRGLALSGVDIAVALTWQAGHPATEAAGPLVQRMLEIPDTEIYAVSDVHSLTPELQRLETRLFAPASPADVLPPSGALRLSEGAGEAGEAQRIAREIQDMAEYGISYGEIAVVFRSAAEVEHRLADAFREVGIPFHVDAEQPLGGSGLGRALLLLLAYVQGGHGRRDLVAYLRSGYAHARPQDVDAMDERLRRVRAGAGAPVVRQAAMLDDATARILAAAESIARAPATAASLPRWHTLLGLLLRARWRDAAAQGRQAHLDAAAHDAVLTAIAELASVTAGGALAEVVELLSELRIAVPVEERDDAVQVMSAERARSRRFRAVICAGLQAGVFPRRSGEGPLGSGAIAEGLAAVGIDASPRTDLAAERLLFYQVVTGARERLVLSRAACDDDGRPLRRSVFWDELLDLYRDPAAEPDADGRQPSYAGMPPLATLGLAELAQAADAPRAERRAQRELAAAGSAATPRLACARARALVRDDHLTGEAAELLATRDVFSVSEIESYLSCPYRWFYERRLSGEPLDRAVDALERGRLGHEALRRFYERWLAEGHERVTPETLAQAHAVLDDVVSAVLADALPPADLTEEGAHQRVRAGTARILARDATLLEGFAPLHHEWGFTPEDPAAQVGSFRLRGRIDRVDVGPAGVIVSDYKGSVVTPRAKFAESGLVQVPLYALIASRTLDLPAVGGLYRSMGSAADRGFFQADAVPSAGLVSTDACSAVDVAALIDDAVARAQAAVDGIRAGAIPSVPGDARTCERCAARGVCRRPA